MATFRDPGATCVSRERPNDPGCCDPVKCIVACTRRRWASSARNQAPLCSRRRYDKNTQAMPPREIKLAQKRLREYDSE